MWKKIPTRIPATESRTSSLQLKTVDTAMLRRAAITITSGQKMNAHRNRLSRIFSIVGFLRRATLVRAARNATR
jgi:hypothetical protein